MVQIIEKLETRDNFKLLIKEKKYIIVKAEASWCGPCKKVSPIFENLINKYNIENLIVYKLDVDEDDDVAAFLKINKLPTFISYINGDKMDIVMGTDEILLESLFKKFQGHMAF
jgi:thioredoxin 1